MPARILEVFDRARRAHLSVFPDLCSHIGMVPVVAGIIEQRLKSASIVDRGPEQSRLFNPIPNSASGTPLDPVVP